jgi:hypothetical protein
VANGGAEGAALRPTRAPVTRPTHMQGNYEHARMLRTYVDVKAECKGFSNVGRIELIGLIHTCSCDSGVQLIGFSRRRNGFELRKQHS